MAPVAMMSPCVTIAWLVASAAAAQVTPPTGAQQAQVEAGAAAGDPSPTAPAAAQAPAAEPVSDAQPPQEPPSQPPAQPGADAPGAAPTIDPRAFEALQLQVLELSDEIEMLREDAEFQEDRLKQTLPKANLLSGYVDLGFFWVQGDGSGIRNDQGYRHYPEYADSGIPDTWVFRGDPLSTAVNSRGEPADTGESRALVFDSLDSGGGPSFAINAVGVNVFAALSEDATVTAMVDLLPRLRNVSDPEGVGLGDMLDVKLAYAEYIVPTDAVKLSLFAGKFDSVLGVEYRSQDAPDRLGVTPSLICRYTCGRPIGVKARLTLFDALVANVSLSNGSHMMEMFPFYNEIDLNGMPTAAGRLSLWVSRSAGLDVGVSGSIGPQDFQTETDVMHMHGGFDLRLDWNDLIVVAEFVIGEAKGATESGSDVRCDGAACLEYLGAYGKIGYRVSTWLTPYVRGDFRDALHQSGGSFVYLSELWRATVGAQVELGERAALKAEYILNKELTEGPEFPNDVFTSSLVLKY